jgi:hypothetical protein
MTVGEWIRSAVIKMKTQTIFDVLLNIGLWIATFLLITYLLLLANAFHPLVNWLLAVWAWFLVWKRKEYLMQMWTIILDTLNLAITATKQTKRIILFLLVITCMYYFFWFSLSFIPYPTAWDANHAYMFYPKMRALHWWLDWFSNSILATPHLRYWYIAYWFSLFQPFGTIMGIMPDTFAVQMNFLSGIFVLLFGVWALAELLNLLKDTTKHDKGPSLYYAALWMWWFYWLLWLTSWMWAFLVFVDNKTDLWVLSLILLALYGGFVFLRTVSANNYVITPESKRMVIISWVFFALAAASKPTAMFDVANFGFFLWVVLFGFIGVLWLFLLIMWVLALMKFRGISDYIPQSLGRTLASMWAWLFLVDGIWVIIRRKLRYMSTILWRAWSFIIALLLIKAPFEIIHTVFTKPWYTPSQLVERILLGYLNGTPRNKSKKSEALPKSLPPSLRYRLQAQVDLPSGASTQNPTNDEETITQTTVSDVSVNAMNTDSAENSWIQQKTLWMCTLSALWLTQTSDLYKSLVEVRGDAYTEDVGRYIWFWWKGWTTDANRGMPPFVNPRRWKLLPQWCTVLSPFTWNDNVPALLCEQENVWRSEKAADIKILLDQIPQWHRMHEYMSMLYSIRANEPLPNQEESASAQIWRLADTLASIDGYMQDYTIKVVDETDGTRKIYIPYKFLNIFNVSFNWSLQNLSSYYTDIGIVWLVLFFFLFVGLIHASLTRNKIVGALSIVSIFGWLLWWLIGWWILWYAIGIIARTILTFIAFLWSLIDTSTKTNALLSYVFLSVITLVGGIQLSMNYTRIASQWWAWPFLWYKSNVWLREEFDSTLTRSTPIVSNFGSDDIFALQFWHYKPIIEVANKRDLDNEGMLIAGTYLSYFLQSQRNIKQDWFLSWLANMASDSDVCATYLRLKDQKITYLVIDPNIGTVVQWWWNQTLFDRFFARINPNDGTILEDGAISMIAKLVDAWYAELVTTNNIWAYYWLKMPDEYFAWMSQDERVLTRARMTIARFWWSNTPHVSNIMQTATQRLMNGELVSELSQILWKTVRIDLLQSLIAAGNLRQEDIEPLTQDERAVFSQFVWLLQLFQNNNEQWTKQIVNLVQQSIQWGSQVIVVRIK